MKINQEGIDLVKECETFSPVKYICPAGKETIGYGHVIKSGEYFLEPMPEVVGEELLKFDLEIAEKAVSKFITAYLNVNQFSALVSFTFNVGAGALEVSTVRRVLNAGYTELVPSELNRWVFADGKKLNGLIKRRKAEAELFQKV